MLMNIFAGNLLSQRSISKYKYAVNINKHLYKN